MGKGYQGKAKFNRKRQRGDDDDGGEDARRSYDERHKGSIPLEDIKASEAYTRRTESTGPKRKYAICLGYLGTNYRGLQINPDTKSIEQELERALFLAGGIHELNYGFLQKIQWSRSARTDAGVHAVAQCCSMRLTIADDKSGFMDRVNSFLPEDIRVHTITKVTKAFNAKLYCVRRRYHYIMPTYLLFDQSKAEEYIQSLFSKEDVTTVPYVTYGDTPAEPSKTVTTLSGKSLEDLRNFLKSYRITPDTMERLRAALTRYVGTNNYHNFTSGKDFKDTNSQRYIISFDCHDPFIAPSGVEYVLLSVVGQSFLLNQIRKMVAMAIEVARGRVTMETMNRAFSSAHYDIPMAPGVGLYLDELFFDGYNLKVDYHSNENQKAAPTSKAVAAPPDEAAATEVTEANDAKLEEGDNEDALVVHEKIEWQNEPAVSPKINHFRENILWPHIYSQEETGLHFATYFDFLRIVKHRYFITE